MRYPSIKRYNRGKRVYKLGQTKCLAGRLWDSHTYHPEKGCYAFALSIVGYGEFAGTPNPLLTLEQTVFSVPFFASRRVERGGGEEFFEFDTCINILDEVQNVLLQYDVEFSVVDLLSVDLSRPKREVVPPLPVKQNHTPTTLRPYQANVISLMLSLVKGLFKMATGTGKTRTFVEYIRESGYKRVCILVPSIQIAEQVVTEAEKTNLPVHRNYDGKMDMVVGTEYLIVSTYQGSDNVKFLDFDVCVFDECHRTTISERKENSLFQKMLKSKKVERKFFFSATSKFLRAEDDTELISMDNEEYYGALQFDYGTDRAITDGYLTDYRIHIISTPDKDETLFKFLASGTGRYRIVFCENVSTVERLYKAGKDKGLEVYMIHGSERTQEELFRRSPNPCTIFACKMLEEGYDNPRVDTVVHYNTPSNPITSIQRNGRALRLDKDKTGAHIVFFVEDIEDIRDLQASIAVMTLEDSRLRSRFEKARSGRGGVQSVNVCMDGLESHEVYSRMLVKLDPDYEERIGYREMQKLLLEKGVKTKEQYAELVAVDERFPPSPEEHFAGRAFDWIDFLSLNRADYYTRAEFDEKVRHVTRGLEVSKVARTLCATDPKFPPEGLWCEYYKVRNMNELVRKKKKRRALKIEKVFSP